EPTLRVRGAYPHLEHSTARRIHYMKPSSGSSWHTGHRADTLDKAPTARLQPRSKLLRGHQKAIAFTKRARRKRPATGALSPPAAERSALCPVCPRGVRYSMSEEPDLLDAFRPRR